MDHAGTPRRAQEAADGAGTAAPGGANGGAASCMGRGRQNMHPKGASTCCPRQVGTGCLCMVGRALGRHGSGLHRRRPGTHTLRQGHGPRRDRPAGRRKQQMAQAQPRLGAQMAGRPPCIGRDRQNMHPKVAVHVAPGSFPHNIPLYPPSHSRGSRGSRLAPQLTACCALHTGA